MHIVYTWSECNTMQYNTNVKTTMSYCRANIMTTQHRLEMGGKLGVCAVLKFFTEQNKTIHKTKRLTIQMIN